VRDQLQRLAQDQALLRLEAIDAPAQRLAEQGQFIEGWVVAAQGQTKAALAGRGTMTRSRVATLAREGRQHVLHEGDWFLGSLLAWDQDQEGGEEG
jgi:hypothetical protein